MTRPWFVPDRPLTDEEWAASGSFAEDRDKVAEAKRFNPYHGEHGLFTSGGGGISNTLHDFASDAHSLQVEDHPEDGQTPRQLARVEKAQAAIESALPKANVDLTGMDPKLAEDTAKSMRLFAATYPGAAASIENVRMEDLDGHAVAQTSPDIDGKVQMQEGSSDPEDVSGYSVMLNREYFDQGSLRATNAMMKRDGPGERDFHPESTPRAAVDHELGHVLDLHLLQTMGPDAMPSNKLVDHLNEATGSESEKGIAYSKLAAQMTEDMGSRGIGYALQGGPQEAFAELFAVAQQGHGAQLSTWSQNLLSQARADDTASMSRSLWRTAGAIPNHTCVGYVSPEARAVFDAEKANG